MFGWLSRLMGNRQGELDQLSPEEEARIRESRTGEQYERLYYESEEALKRFQTLKEKHGSDAPSVKRAYHALLEAREELESLDVTWSRAAENQRMVGLLKRIQRETKAATLDIGRDELDTADAELAAKEGMFQEAVDQADDIRSMRTERRSKEKGRFSVPDEELGNDERNLGEELLDNKEDPPSLKE